jgi:peptide/nickel transport system substrate-binding protein
MKDDDESNRWQQLKNTRVNRKLINKRVRRASDVTLRHARKFVFKRWSNIREVRWHVLVWSVALGILIAATGLQVMWYQQGYRTSAVAVGGTYAEAILGPVDTLNPLFASSHAEQSLSRLLFSRLFTYDTTGNLKGDLATSMTIDSSNRIYTIKIRPDAMWQDGYRLTASDIAFTIGLFKNPAVRSTNPEDWSRISVKVIDDMTLQFSLPAVIAAFPHALTFPIVPEHVLSKVEPNSLRENMFSSSPVASGPFKLRLLQDIDPNNGLKIVNLERNTSYYGGLPKVEFFQVHVYSTQNQILSALSNGEVNAAADLSSSDTKQVDSKRYKLDVTPIKSGVYALFNTTRGALQDKAVRKALQTGTNTTDIISQLSPRTPHLDLPFIDGQLTGDVPKAPAYDVVSAKRQLDDDGWLLDASGHRAKNGQILKLSVVTIKDDDYERVLETLAGQWRQLGVQVDTVVIDPSDTSRNAAQETLQSRDYDVLIYQLSIGADPDVYAYWHSSQANSLGLNLSNYSNSIADDALVSARSRLEPTLRNAKYITFARQWLADAPAVGLYQSVAYYYTSYNDRSYNDKNVFVSQFDRYQDVLYWSVGSQTVYKTP